MAQHKKKEKSKKGAITASLVTTKVGVTTKKAQLEVHNGNNSTLIGCL